MPKPHLVDLQILRDTAGFIGVVEGQELLPFDVKRFYFIGDVLPGAVRGSHAHKTLDQLIIAVSGSVTIELDDGREVEEFTLAGPSSGLVVPPGYWRTLRDFAAHTVVGVLASATYDETDYIRDYDDFLEWAHGR
ncbi:sugar 3,4-ketoisomerase [Microbacterium sp. ASV49]|uniref:FdtA/QdtA family cupin domain-containing protein n=1 Tax=Microbacterium candidum TaxID=3041922 RepID=A0ABT7N0T4_9MICO|nr:FdtA/QdtA family cupin domain-containing protein [Microbacterium sp. ASV49]MDL9980297.1 FdtA/QdtA family cupin domain-containing protein [Microbacterium sp. ASV49]